MYADAFPPIYGGPVPGSNRYETNQSDEAAAPAKRLARSERRSQTRSSTTTGISREVDFWYWS